MKNAEINEKTSMFLLAGPIFAELLLNILLNNIDTVMLSRYSSDSVGAVGNSNQMMMMFIIMCNIIASATGVVVSQYLGAKRLENMNTIYSMAVLLNLALGMLLSVVMFLFAGNFMSLLKVSEVQFRDAVDYTRWVGGFLFLQAGYNVMIQILRCHGYTKIGLIISLIVNFINIFGNWLFLYGPLKYLGLGVTGVAISTVVARFMALLVAFLIFFRYRIGKISFRYMKPFRWGIFSKMLRVGIPSAGENLAYNIYQLVLLSFINEMGPVAANAKVYANTLMSFSVVFSNSMAQATMIVTGHLVGAGKENEADRRVRKTLRTALPVAVIIASANFISCPLTLRIFSANAEEIRLVQQILMVGILMEIGRTTNLVCVNSMKAAGDVLFPVLIGMVTMWLIGIGVGYTCGVALSLGVAGVFAGTTADECLRGLIIYVRWRLGAWRGKAMVKAQKQ